MKAQSCKSSYCEPFCTSAYLRKRRHECKPPTTKMNLHRLEYVLGHNLIVIDETRLNWRSPLKYSLLKQIHLAKLIHEQAGNDKPGDEHQGPVYMVIDEAFTSRSLLIGPRMY